MHYQPVLTWNTLPASSESSQPFSCCQELWLWAWMVKQTGATWLVSPQRVTGRHLVVWSFLCPHIQFPQLRIIKMFIFYIYFFQRKCLVFYLCAHSAGGSMIRNLICVIVSVRSFWENWFIHLCQETFNFIHFVLMFIEFLFVFFLFFFFSLSLSIFFFFFSPLLFLLFSFSFFFFSFFFLFQIDNVECIFFQMILISSHLVIAVFVSHIWHILILMCYVTLL